MFRFLSALTYIFVLVPNKVLSSPHRWEKVKQIQRRLAEGTNIIIDRFFPFLFCWQWHLNTHLTRFQLGTRSVVWHFRLLSLAWVWAGASSPMLDCLGGVNTLFSLMGMFHKILTLGLTLWSSWMLQRKSPSKGVALVRRGENIAHLYRNGQNDIEYGVKTCLTQASIPALFQVVQNRRSRYKHPPGGQTIMTERRAIMTKHVRIFDCLMIIRNYW